MSSLSSGLFAKLHRNHDNGFDGEGQEVLDDLSINKLILNSETQGGAKYYYLESTVDKAEIPFVSEDYVLRMAISTQLDIAAAIIGNGDFLLFENFSHIINKINFKKLAIFRYYY